MTECMTSNIIRDIRALQYGHAEDPMDILGTLRYVELVPLHLYLITILD